jgi:hypothetical protein
MTMMLAEKARRGLLHFVRNDNIDFKRKKFASSRFAGLANVLFKLRDPALAGLKQSPGNSFHSVVTQNWTMHNLSNSHAIPFRVLSCKAEQSSIEVTPMQFLSRYCHAKLNKAQLKQPSCYHFYSKSLQEFINEDFNKIQDV